MLSEDGIIIKLCFREALKLIKECAAREAQVQLTRLEARLKEWIRGARQGIAQESTGQSAGELSTGLVINIVDGVKASLNHLTVSISFISFSHFMT